ncbi:DUF2236 domain-containing protein [Streptomyces sp. LBUM 1478]|nr:DUF2236 domain-containing protein [Streptomyces sp. LBUM 1478]
MPACGPQPSWTGTGRRPGPADRPARHGTHLARFHPRRPQALAAVGIDVTGEEERRLYRYWAYVAHLLGVDQSLYEAVADHAGARRLQDMLDAMTPSPDDTSRTATAAVIGAQAHATAQAPARSCPRSGCATSSTGCSDGPSETRRPIGWASPTTRP